MIAGRSAPASSAAASSTPSAGWPARSRRRGRDLRLGLAGRRRRAGSRRRSGRDGAASAGRSPPRSAPGSGPVSLTVTADLTSGATNGRWSISWSEPEPQRISGARPPSTHERRAVLLRAGDRAHPVGHPGAGGQRADARLARRLRVALRRPGRRGLVAGVDDLDPLLLAAVVDREQVSAREGEQTSNPPRGKRAGDEAPAVDRSALALRRARRLIGRPDACSVSLALSLLVATREAYALGALKRRPAHCRRTY